MRRILIAAVCMAAAAVLSSPATAMDCTGISPVAGLPLTTIRLVSGLTRPVFLTAPAGDLDRLFIVEQNGRVLIYRDGAVQDQPFMDIGTVVRSPADGGGNEEGLLGLAFHPDHDTNGWVFVYTTLASGDNAVVRYTLAAGNPDLIDTATRQVVLTIPHPGQNNHNGGMLAFGPDGMLYVATGDGGGSCDTGNNAQTLSSLLGKLLRLNVDALPYTIPPDNPFAGQFGVAGEIWAYGLRNPSRFSLDAVTGDLYTGDVGQNAWEEINVQPAASAGGINYGWKVYEADACPNPSCIPAPACNSISNGTLPVHKYSLSGQCAVTGGYVYRGCRLPDLAGRYFYADFCSSEIHSFIWNGSAATMLQEWTATLEPGAGLDIGWISSFGQDNRGALYLLDLGGFAGGAGAGEIFKIVPLLSAMEVSGQGAAPFVPGSPDWIWENLAATSGHPVLLYRVYRRSITTAGASGSYTCVAQLSQPAWTGGDLDPLAQGAVNLYLITGVNGAGLESSPGTGTGGLPRLVDPGTCP